MSSTNPINDLSTVDVNKIKSTDSNSSSKKKSNKLDQDAFVRILVAQMSNLNPDSNQDPSQYVAEMAQFSSVEQMLNLNRTMTFNGASSLIGKNVTTKVSDSDGNPYRGIVEKVTKNGDDVKVYLNLLDQNGNQMYQEKLDSNGNVIYKDGKPVYVTVQKAKVDSNGKAINDPETGKPVYEEVPVNKVMAFDYADVDGASNYGFDIADTQQEAESDAKSESTDQSKSTTQTS